MPKILIIGAGIIGLAIGSRLASFGYDVTIIDRTALTPQHGTSNTWVLMDIAAGPTPQVARLSAATFAFLLNAPSYYPKELLRPGGVVHIAERSFGQVRNLILAAQAADLRYEDLDQGDLLRAFPELVADHARGAIRVSAEDAPEVEVSSVYAGLMARFRVRDGQLRRDEELLHAEFSGGAWQVQTSRGLITADVLVNAAGADAEKVAGRCGVPSMGLLKRKRTTIVGRVDETAGRRVRAERSPRMSWVEESGLIYRTEPHGEIWLSPVEDTPTIVHSDTADPLATAVGIERLHGRTNYRIENRLVRTWAGTTISRGPAQSSADPVICWDRRARSFFWAAGFRDFGVQCSIAVGDLATDLLLGRHNERKLYEDFGIEPSAFELVPA